MTDPRVAIVDLTREELTEFARLVALACGPYETQPNPLTRITDRQRLGDWCGERGGEGLVFLRLVKMATVALALNEPEVVERVARAIALARDSDLYDACRTSEDEDRVLARVALSAAVGGTKP